MTENQTVETLTAKASEPDTSPATPQKGKRWVRPLIWALSILLALCVGTVVGGGVVYGVIRVKDRFVTSRAQPSVRTFRFGPGDSTVDWPTYGALIVEVTEDSPAERAGLTEGSVIVAVDGQELDAERGLAERIAGFKPGDKVTLELWEAGGGRAQRTSEVEVTLGEHPEQAGAAYLGVTFVPFPGGGPHMEWRGPFGDFRFDCEGDNCDTLPFDDGRMMPFFQGAPFDRGAAVQSVVPDSPASGAGLRPGDVIGSIDGEAVADAAAVSEAIEKHKPGDEIALHVYRPADEQELDITVTLGEHPDNKGKAYLGVEIGGFFRMERHFEGEQAPRSFRFFGMPGREDRGAGRWFEFRGLPHGKDVEWSDMLGRSI